MNKLLVLLLFGFITMGCNQSEDTITLIPSEFRGTIKINFNKENGTDKQYEGEKRVYKIPKNGTLNTKFEPQFGYHFPEYFLLKENGKRTKIQAIGNLNKKVLSTLDKNKTYVYNILNMSKLTKIDSLGNEVFQKDNGIIFTVGNPLN